MVSLVTEKNTLNDRYKDLEITSKPRYKLRVDYVDKFLSDVQRDFNELHSQIKVAISIDQAASRQNAQKDGFMMLMQEEEIEHKYFSNHFLSTQFTVFIFNLKVTKTQAY